MRKQTQSYLTFSRKELNGILVLFVLIALILSFPYAYRLFDKAETYELKSFQKEIAAFKSSGVSTGKKYSRTRERMKERESRPDYFTFDPNTLSESGWLQLGLSPRQARVVRNYVSKGGKFYTPEDLSKIYSIRKEQYHQLKAYIRISATVSKHPPSQQTMPAVSGASRIAEPELVELNAADSAELDGLRGIGPAFASRIIRYRDRLGGFHSSEQLREVYGMDSLRYVQLAAQVSIDRSVLVRHNINTATFEQLRTYPYLSYKQINAIIQYRRQHGNYASATDLRKVLILNEEIIRKIEPYLVFEP
jgi:competence protein ComEA